MNDESVELSDGTCVEKGTSGNTSYSFVAGIDQFNIEIVHTCGGVLHEHRTVTMIILCSMLSIRSRGVSALIPCPGVGDLATASRRSVRCVFCCSNCSFSVRISAFRVSSSAFCLWTNSACRRQWVCELSCNQCVQPQPKHVVLYQGVG